MRTWRIRKDILLNGYVLVITGKLCDSHEWFKQHPMILLCISWVTQAWNLHEKGRKVELIDGKLSVFNKEEVKRVIGIALLCIQSSYSLRPPMSRVVAMLTGDVEVSDVVSKPGYLTDWRFDDTTTTSLSGFETKETSAYNGSKISLGSTDSQPMLGANIKLGR